MSTTESKNFTKTLARTVINFPKIEARLSQGIFYDKIDSTNEEALRLAKDLWGGNLLLVANEQTAGRGRLRRHWSSPEGKGLYFSLLLKPQLEISSISAVTIAAGIGLARAIKSFENFPLVIKWPNDIWLQKKKIAGILTESVYLGKNLEYVVIGIGLNVFSAESSLPEEIRHKVGSLEEFKKTAWSRDNLLIEIIPSILDELDHLQKSGKEALFKKWEDESHMIGRDVFIENNLKRVSAKVLGLSQEGYLELKLENGELLKKMEGDVELI